MRNLLRFYENKVSANNKFSYLRDDIINLWPDFRFQTRKNYITWFFPLENDINNKLTKGLLYKFRTNQYLRSQVIRIVLRYMSFLGYSIKIENNKPVDVVEIKPIYREENGVIIGLYNKDNYSNITRILQFLQIINMSALGMIFFLMLCRSMKTYPDLKHKINSELVIPRWIKTQPYLVSQKIEAEESLLGEVLESWEREYENTSDNEEDNKDDRDSWNEKLKAEDWFSK
jgi:hypothetical protein